MSSDGDARETYRALRLVGLAAGVGIGLGALYHSATACEMVVTGGCANGICVDVWRTEASCMEFAGYGSQFFWSLVGVLLLAATSVLSAFTPARLNSGGSDE